VECEKEKNTTVILLLLLLLLTASGYVAGGSGTTIHKKKTQNNRYTHKTIHTTIIANTITQNYKHNLLRITSNYASFFPK
jgi:hypothetical protein